MAPFVAMHADVTDVKELVPYDDNNVAADGIVVVAVAAAVEDGETLGMAVVAGGEVAADAATGDDAKHELLNVQHRHGDVRLEQNDAVDHVVKRTRSCVNRHHN